MFNGKTSVILVIAASVVLSLIVVGTIVLSALHDDVPAALTSALTLLLGWLIGAHMQQSGPPAPAPPAAAPPDTGRNA